MKASDIYRKAAERLDGRYLCGACNVLEGLCQEMRGQCYCFHWKDELRKFFDDRIYGVYWLGGKPTKEGKPVRVLALLLMSEISRGEK